MPVSMPTGWTALVAAGETSPSKLLGNGVLALTIDQGAHTQRYQGIVQLDGASLEDAARTYFRQSEQIPTDVRLSVAKLVTPGDDGAREHWRAGGILAQFLPQGARAPAHAGSAGRRWRLRATAIHDPVDNSWQELLALLATIEPTELIDPTIGAERLLYRLFHEHGVRVFEGVRGCRPMLAARATRSAASSKAFPPRRSRTAPKMAASASACEFCSKAYDFDPAEFAAARVNSSFLSPRTGRWPRSGR